MEVSASLVGLEISPVIAHLDFMAHHVKAVSEVAQMFQFLSNASFLLFIVIICLVEPEGTHPVDQQVLVDFYTSLTSRGILKWDTALSICRQFGLSCENGKVVYMYVVSFLRLGFYFAG